MIVSTDAIVLKSKKFRDSSKLVTLYTHDEGMITVIAKGARGIKSKFGSAVQPMSIIFASFYKKANRDLHLLSKAELKTPLNAIVKSIEKMAVGMAIMESVIQTQEKSHINNELYSLLENKLIKLNTIKIHPFTIFISFHIRLAELMGFGIDFAHINKKNDKYTFYFPEGTFIDEILYDVESTFVLNKFSVDIIRDILNKKSKNFTEMSFKSSTINQIANFFAQYFSFHLEKKIYYNSLSLLNG